MIEVKHLTKFYGDKPAVDDISFSVKQGEILGFLGPNGAGKTTTMNMITGYLSSTEGTVTVDGYEILEHPRQVKSRIGYLPEQPPLYLDMTVAEYLSFLYQLKKVRLDKREHIGKICEMVGLEDVTGRLIKNLSKGYRQRVGLGQALLGDPGLLILDEPTAGLDPMQIIEIRNLIKELGQKHTIILSSHILPEVQATCERVIVIHNGKLLADDTPDNLSQSMRGEMRLSLQVRGPQDGVLRLLKSLPGVQSAKHVGQREAGVQEYLLGAKPGKDVRGELFRKLAEKDWPIYGVKADEMSLEDIFLQLTREDADAPEEDEKPKKKTKRSVRKAAEKQKQSKSGGGK